MTGRVHKDVLEVGWSPQRCQRGPAAGPGGRRGTKARKVKNRKAKAPFPAPAKGKEKKGGTRWVPVKYPNHSTRPSLPAEGLNHPKDLWVASLQKPVSVLF